jgi:hypothetical protein
MTTLSPTRCVQSPLVAKLCRNFLTELLRKDEPLCFSEFQNCLTKLFPIPGSRALMGTALVFFGCLSGGSAKAQSVSVDPVSGGLSATIPIYNLTYGNISVPVNLVRTSAGMKVEDSEGNAGMGWNLSCTNYGVFRTVRGLPDDHGTGGWLSERTAARINKFSPSSDDFLSTYSDETPDFDSLLYFSLIDAEPDLYAVSAPGLYFQFVYDTSGIPRILGYQDVKIIPLGLDSGFTVKNNTGLTYQFTTRDSISRRSTLYNTSIVDMFSTEYGLYSAAAIGFTQSWHLSSITDQNGEKVTFTYTKTAQSVYNAYTIRVRTVTGHPDTLYTTTDTSTPKAVSSIAGGNYTVNFSWTGSERIASLKVSEVGLGDSFQYGFSYIAASTIIGIPRIHYHYFLSKLTPVFSSSCLPQAPYTFDYQGVTAGSYVDGGWQTYFGQDAWGYYNGVLGSPPTTFSDVPPAYYYNAQSDGRSLSVFPLTGFTPDSTFSGISRNVVSTKIGVGELIRITYPTGGNTKITWERNKYKDTGIGQVFYGPGLRVATIISDGGEAAYGANATASNAYHQLRKDYTYTLSDTDTTTSGSVLYPPEFAFHSGKRLIRTIESQSPGTYVLYSRVKETTSGQGARVYQFSLPAMYPQDTYSTDWTATKSLFARNPTTHYSLNYIYNQPYTFPFAPNPNYDFARGLPTRQSEYSETGALVRDRQFVYSRISPALMSVYGLKFERLGPKDCDCFFFSKYQVITGTTSVLTQQTSREISESNSSDTTKVVTSYFYNNDATHNNFLMDSVRTVYSDGSVNQTKIKYVKDYAAITSPASGDIMANAIATMIAANRHGQVVEQYSRFQPAGGTLALTGGTLQLFKNHGGGKVYPYQAYSLRHGASGFAPSSVVSGTTQGFLYSSANYLLTTSADDYDTAGNVASVSDNQKNRLAYHNATKYASAPVATFSNATARQTVYEGFEFSTGRNLTATSTLTYGTGWTGVNAAILSSSNSLYNTSVDNAGIPYRISCHVNGTATSTITFKFIKISDGSTQATTTFSYATGMLNQWTYFEGTLNATSAMGTSLKVLITSSASSILIDDVIVMPQTATVNTQTFLPFKGVTSQTDDRGNSTVRTYDPLGRPFETFDRQRNLTEMDEYQVKGVPENFISSAFTYPGVTVGQSFTASLVGATCFGTVSYEWRKDTTVISGATSSSVTTSFSTTGTHTLQLKVTNGDGQSSTTIQNICVMASNTAPSFTLANSPTGTSFCQATHVTFSLSGLSTTCAYGVTWQASTDGGTHYTILTADNNLTSIDYLVPVSPPSFIIKVTVSQTCTGNGDPTCPGTSTKSTTQSGTYTIIKNCP